MKKIFLTVIVLSLVLSACKSKTDSKKEGDPARSTVVNTNPDATVIVDVSINGMTCTGCENTIKSSIAELPGVVEVNASFTDGKAVVKLDTTLTKMVKITEVVNSRGYTVTGSKLSEK